MPEANRLTAVPGEWIAKAESDLKAAVKIGIKGGKRG
jgi:hypothetical protein